MDPLVQVQMQIQISTVRAVIESYDDIMKKTAEMFNLSAKMRQKLDNMAKAGLNAIETIEKEVVGTHD